MRSQSTNANSVRLLSVSRRSAPGNWCTLLRVSALLMVAAVLSAAPALAQDYTSNLVAHWALDDGSGTTAADSSGNGRTGTLNGNPTWQTVAKIGGGLDFETTDGVDRIDVGTFDLAGSGVSMAAWINTENGFSDSRLLIKSTSNDGADQLWGMTLASSSRFDFRIRCGGKFEQLDTANGVITAGQWHHVAGTYDGTTMRVYVDGVEVASMVHSVGGNVDQDNSAPVAIGDSPQGGRTYDGVLDDVRLYDRALSEKDIAALYAAAPRIFYVRPDGNDSNSGTGPSASEAWRTIDNAVNESLAPGDIVYVMAGTYTERVRPSVSGAAGRPIQLIGDTTGAVFGTVGDVILAATSGDNALEIDDENYLSFTGLRIVGSGTTTVDINRSVGTVFQQCSIIGGTRGIYIDDSTTTVDIINCLIYSCSSDGIRMADGTVTVHSTTIDSSGSDGIEQDSGNLTVTNSIITNSSSDGLDRNSGTMTHTYNNVWNSGGSDYEGTSASTGEISLDPEFVASNDHRLKGTSPCIDAGADASGTADVDLAGTARPIGSGWDMGCFEGVSLVAYWKLDEGSGTTAADSSGNGHDGTFNGSPLWLTNGMKRGALEFDSSDGNDRIDIGNFDVTGNALTLAAWIRQDTPLNDGRVLIKSSSNSSADQSWGLTVDQTGELDFRVKAGGTWQRVQAPGAIVSGTWYHVAGTYDGATMRLYINGDEVQATAHSPGGAIVADSSHNVTIGDSTVGGRPFDGAVDDVRVYNLTLTSDEITELYGLIGHWKLDETSGFDAIDSSGLANDGGYWNGATPNSAGPYPGAGAVAAEFYGDTSHVGMDEVDAYNREMEEFSVATWVRFDESLADQTFQQYLIERSDWGSQTGFSLMCNQPYGDSLLFRVMNGTTYGDAAWDNSGIKAGDWHHVVGTYDGATIKLYVDGELKASQPFTGSMMPDEGTNLNLGFNFDGRLFDARVYNRTLSLAEVNRLYGLEARWKLDETTGTTASDATGNENDGVLTGDFTFDTASISPGQIGDALDFNGTNDYIIVPHSSELSLTSEFSLAGWINSNQLNQYDLLFNKGTASNTWNYWLGTIGDEITFGFHDGSLREFNTSGVDLKTNKWYHIAATFSDTSDEVRIYLDGVEVLSTTTTATPVANTQNLLLGNSQGGAIWNGKLDDLRIYNRQLSADEIAALHGAAKPKGLRIIKWVEVK